MDREPMNNYTNAATYHASLILDNNKEYHDYLTWLTQHYDDDLEAADALEEYLERWIETTFEQGFRFPLARELLLARDLIQELASVAFSQVNWRELIEVHRRK